MDVMAAIMGRRSIRNFLEKDIPTEAITTLKNALIWAPSAGNLQSRRFFFLYNNGIKARLVEAALHQSFISKAPLVVVACADLMIERWYGARGANLYCIQDVACSIENMLLAAHAIGLGSVWIGAFDEGAVSGLLELASHLRPVAIIPIGYPISVPAPPGRVRHTQAIVEVR